MLKTAWTGCFNLFIKIALKVQRLNIHLPAMIHDRLHILLTRGVQNIGQNIEGWTSPLIAGRNDAGTAELGIWKLNASPPSVASYSSGVRKRVKQPTSGTRCLLVTSALDAGGMDEVVVFLARRLPQHGIFTAVLHASAKGTPEGIPSGRLGQLLLEYGVETVEWAKPEGARWLEDWRPDVISAHGAPPWVLDTASRLSIPYVDTLHGMHSHFGVDWGAEAERSRRLTGIVAVSELVRRQYLKGNPAFPYERIVTIPNGVDDERRVPDDRERVRELLGLRDEYLFVSLARYCLQKNVYGLVSAFEEVAALHPEAHLLVSGRPDDAAYFSQLLQLRSRLGCRNRIHLRDHTPNPAQLLAAADGFVLDSFFEGWSLASMEALFAGVPVILSEVGGAREQVGENGERGYVIPNPLGDPFRVNWKTMREVRYACQMNRDALVASMSSFISGHSTWQEKKQKLINDSAARFHPDVCLRSHARILIAAAQREALTVEEQE